MATTQATGTPLDTLLAQLLGGGANSGQGSSSSTTAFGNESGQAVQNILTQMQGLTKDQAIQDSQGVLANLSKQILQQQMPTIAGAQRGAGLYNSTTQQQLQNDLQARTTAALTEATQQNIANYSSASTAASNALANLNSASRTQTSSESRGNSQGQNAGNALASLLISQGLGTLKKKAGETAGTSALGALGGMTSDFGVPTVTDSLASAFGSSGLGLTAGSTGGLGLSSSLMPASANSSLSDIFGGSLGDTLGGISTGVGGVADAVGGGISDIVGGIGDVAGNIGSSIGNAFSDFGSWTGWWANGGRLPGAKAVNGKDNLVVGAGGGEVILPLDTVAMLDSQLGNDWVDKLIKATHTNVIPDPTDKAKAMANKATK